MVQVYPLVTCCEAGLLWPTMCPTSLYRFFPLSRVVKLAFSGPPCVQPHGTGLSPCHVLRSWPSLAHHVSNLMVQVYPLVTCCEAGLLWPTMCPTSWYRFIPLSRVVKLAFSGPPCVQPHGTGSSPCHVFSGPPCVSLYRFFPIINLNQMLYIHSTRCNIEHHHRLRQPKSFNYSIPAK